MITQSTNRYANPDPISTSAIPCATPIVNGFRKAAANPACDPTKGIATPTMSSYPSERASGTKISTNGIVSSAMPNTAPPSEKSVMKTGMIAARSEGERSAACARRRRPASIAPVRWSTPNAPPTMSTKAITSDAATKPRMGAVSTAIRYCGLRSSR